VPHKCRNPCTAKEPPACFNASPLLISIIFTHDVNVYDVNDVNICGANICGFMCRAKAILSTEWQRLRPGALH